MVRSRLDFDGIGRFEDAEGDQLRLIVDLGENDDAILDNAGLEDGSFNFAELDAVAVDLDLAVFAAEAFNLAPYSGVSVVHNCSSLENIPGSHLARSPVLYSLSTFSASLEVKLVWVRSSRLT